MCDRGVFHVDEGSVSEYHGTGSVYWPASEVWQNQYADRVLHPCGAKRGKCRNHRVEGEGTEWFREKENRGNKNERKQDKEVL